MKSPAAALLSGLAFLISSAPSRGQDTTYLVSPDRRFVARNGFTTRTLVILSAKTFDPVCQSSDPVKYDGEGNPLTYADAANPEYFGNEDLLWSPDSRVLAATAHDGRMTTLTHLFIRTGHQTFEEIPCPEIPDVYDGPWIQPRNWLSGHRLVLNVSYPHEEREPSELVEGTAVLEVDVQHRVARLGKVDVKSKPIPDEEESEVSSPVDPEKRELSVQLGARGVWTHSLIWKNLLPPPATPLINTEPWGEVEVWARVLPVIRPQEPIGMFDVDPGVIRVDFDCDLGPTPTTPMVTSDDHKAFSYEDRRNIAEGKIGAVILSVGGEVVSYPGINIAAQAQITATPEGHDLFTQPAAQTHWSVSAIDRSSITLLCPSIAGHGDELLECKLSFQLQGKVKLETMSFVAP